MEQVPEVTPHKTQEQLPLIEPPSPPKAAAAQIGAKPPGVAAIAPVLPSQEEISGAIAQANGAKAARVAEMMARPGVESKPEAEKILAAGDRRAWYANLVPEKLQPHLGIDVEGQRREGTEKAYTSLVDRKADGLLAVRAQALKDLGSVNLAQPAHLLPSKQYRAAEALTRSDTALRELRPLATSAYHNAVAAGRNEPQIGTPVIEKAVARQVSPQEQEIARTPAKVTLAPEVAAMNGYKVERPAIAPGIGISR